MANLDNEDDLILPAHVGKATLSASAFMAKAGDMPEFPLKTFVEGISKGAILIVTSLDDILFLAKLKPM